VSDHCASLPVMASAYSVSSDTSGPTQDISRHLELQQCEEWLEVLLESKLDDFFCKEVWVLWSEAANGDIVLDVDQASSLACTT
jgi:hypothetical protein